MLMLCPKCSAAPARKLRDEVTGEVSTTPATEVNRQFSNPDANGIRHCGNCGFGVETVQFAVQSKDGKSLGVGELIKVAPMEKGESK